MATMKLVGPQVVAVLVLGVLCLAFATTVEAASMLSIPCDDAENCIARAYVVGGFCAGRSDYCVGVAQQLLGMSSITRTFDTTTVNAVKNWQAAHKQPTTGCVSGSMFQDLVSEQGCSGTAVGNQRGRPAVPSVLQGPDVDCDYIFDRECLYRFYDVSSFGLGDSEPCVTLVQQLLGMSTASGTFDEATVAAVKQFQQAHQMTQTGTVTKFLYKILLRLAGCAVPTVGGQQAEILKGVA